MACNHNECRIQEFIIANIYNKFYALNILATVPNLATEHHARHGLNELANSEGR